MNKPAVSPEHGPGILIDRISFAFALVAGLMMLSVALFMSFEAFSRHFLDQPTSWVLAISTLIFIWFTFLSVPYGIKSDKHVACDVFVTLLPARSRQAIGIATDLASLIFIIALGIYGFNHFMEAVKYNSMSDGLFRYPMWLVALSIPIGMVLSVIQFIRKIQTRILWIKKHSEKSSEASSVSPVLMVGFFLLSAAVGIAVYFFSQPIGILIFALALLFWGVPIAFALGLVGLTGLLFFHGSISGLNTLPIVAEHTSTNFILMAIPLFTLGGLILSRSGLGEQIYDLSSKWLGWMPGGLGVGTCITGGILAAMIGSSTAVTAIITLVAMKPLLDRGYDKKLVIGTVTGSSLGLIIPPSIGFIVYGFLTDTSVGDLFMAGVIPGIMLVTMFSIYIVISCKFSGKYEAVSFTWTERLISLRKSFIIILGPAFVLGSIYTGVATPTEAGAILVIYSLFCALIFRKIDWKGFVQCLIDSSILSTMIIMIMVGALVMSNVITLLQIPANLTESILASGMPIWGVILMIVLLYLCLGMFLDGGSITVLTVPVIAPMLPVLGIDTIAFGVILMMLIETALLTPPVGLNLFTVKGIVDEPISFIIKSVIPFVIILTFGIILVFMFQDIALWLPSLMR
ncbi:MAG: TRAP transporter large permease subunit [Desulfobacteraceae bacterium]|nr:TRAP transporter large permease subunit [Desulfobacteraceae bacterium]